MWLKAINFLAVVMSLCVAVMVTPSIYAQNSSIASSLTTDLQDKYYRQALYFYFQNEPAKALSVINHAEQRLGTLMPKSQLFKAGLQVSQGLQQQAQQTLELFDTSQMHDKNHQSQEAQELFTVALLALAEQYLEQGHIKLAQQSLQKLTELPKQYYGQYYLLNQLAYWPQTPKNIATLAMPLSTEQSLTEQSLTEEANQQYSPYITLNQALALIEQQAYEQAITLLKNVETLSTVEKEKTFWSELFSWFDDDLENQSSQASTQKTTEQQALQDYARLLLAQIYVKQENYDGAFLLLEGFPQHSPYTESALFLFALASQKVKQYTMSYNLWALLYKKYPYSQLGWQAAALLAEQVTQQKTLAQGLNVYQDIEQFYLQQLSSLQAFKSAFDHHDNLLTFSTSIANNTPERFALVNQQNYQPVNIWLQKALSASKLTTHYQALGDLKQLEQRISVFQQQFATIEHIINLNQQRNKGIIHRVQQANYDEIIHAYQQQRDSLATILESASLQENSEIFADPQEQHWLARIEKSQQYINHIAAQRNIEAYQKRLDRVAGVLAWQLKKPYPQRLWQHKKQLKALNEALNQLTKQQQQLVLTSKNQPSLTQFITRYQQLKTKVELLQHALSQAKKQVSSAVRTNIADYVTAQKAMLQNYLLIARRNMAKILEQMSAQDKKISKQLNSEALISAEGGKQ